MLPDPLHPAVVHLPIALAVLLPLAAVGLVLAIGRQFVPARAWAFVVLLQLLLAGSAWLAIETGEHEEDRVEHVVAERFIESHEEAAERFAILAGVALLVVGAGLAPGSLGRFARIASIAATAGVLATGVAVGHSGGAQATFAPVLARPVMSPDVDVNALALSAACPEIVNDVAPVLPSSTWN